MGRLIDFTASFTSVLGEVAGYLDQTARDQSDSDYKLGLWTMELSFRFQGKTAAAFNTLVDDYENQASAACIASLESASEALQTCVNTITSDAEATEARLSDPYTILSQVLGQVSLNDIAANGGSSLNSIVTAIGTQLYDQYIYNIEHSPDAPSPGVDIGWQQRTSYLDYVGNLLDVLPPWGDDVQRAMKTLNAAIAAIKMPAIKVNQNDNAALILVPGFTPVTIDQVSEAQFTLILDPNMQNLSQLIFSHYVDQQGTHPFGITQIGPNSILVNIGGLELDKWGQSNNLFGAMDTGAMGELDSLYATQINAAIQQYLKDHHLPPGTRVVLAGHSLGGMAAQVVAQENEQKGRPFNITNVITFGSPPMYDPKTYPKVDYTLYRDWSDPVPRLSSYNILNADIPENTLETVVPDVGNATFGVWQIYGYSWDPTHGLRRDWTPGLNAHGQYVDSSWLGKESVPFSMGYYGPTTSYPAPAPPPSPAPPPHHFTQK